MFYENSNARSSVAAARGAMTAAAAASDRSPCARNMHVHECTLRRSGAPPTAGIALSDAALSPNYFGQTCLEMTCTESCLVSLGTNAHSVFIYLLLNFLLVSYFDLE